MSTALAPPPSPPAAPRPYRWSRADYYRLGELGFLRDRRVELIRGEIVEMSPIGWPHTLAKQLTADVLRQVFAGVGWVNEQNPFHGEESSAPQPDVSVIPGRPRDLTDHPMAALLIVEVADTTVDYDTTTKAELYATAGVPDYWVVDLESRRLLVFRDPQPLAAGLGATAYRTRLGLGPSDALSPLAAPTASIRVADLLP